jgi:F-type H+-transporting ATPase subunit epsilon
MSFTLSVLDTERKIFEGEVEKLTLSTSGGEITVLQEHMPIVTPITLGEVRFKSSDKEVSLTVGKGIFSMENNIGTLLIESASYIEEIKEAAAMEAIKRAEEIVQKGETGPDLEAAMATIRRANLDLKVSRRRKPRLEV